MHQLDLLWDKLRPSSRASVQLLVKRVEVGGRDLATFPRTAGSTGLVQELRAQTRPQAATGAEFERTAA